jgi:HAMP domain-containing protein
VIAKPENNLERKTVWSNIYLDSVGHGLLTTASTPVYSKNGEYLGAAGVDITLDTIVKDILSHIPSCHRMEGLVSFLVDNQGRLIAFPPEYLDLFEIKIDRDKLVDATVILKHSLLDSSNLEIRKIGESMLEKKYEVSGFILNGQPYIISSHFMPSTGWRLGVVVPESVILASVQETRDTLDLTVKKMTGTFTLVAVFFLIISIIVIAIFSIKSVIRPLGKLSKGALRVKEGDLTTHVDIHTKDEIGSLAQSFNNMIDNLHDARDREKEYTQTLEQRVEDRTREITIKKEELKKTLQVRKQAEEALQQERDKLQKTLSEVKTLRGFLPICAHCKKIRDDKGYWNQIESYIRDRSDAEFSHGICPECAKKLYPDMDLYDDNGEVTQD